MFHKEIVTFKVWCDSPHLIFNICKRKEIIFYPTEVRVHEPVIIGEQVSSYEYLGIQMGKKLKVFMLNVCVSFSSEFGDVFTLRDSKVYLI